MESVDRAGPSIRFLRVPVVHAPVPQGRDVIAPLRFELVDYARNRRRFYALAMVEDRQLSLTNDSPRVVLVVTRGRLGEKAIIRRESFDSFLLALERWGELARRRRRNGYAEVT